MADILIRGMEMPKNCQECWLYIEGACYGKGYRDYRLIMDTAKPDDCPLVELPPHGRLGDLDALIKDLAVYRGGHNEGYGFDGGMYEAYNNSIELLEEAPTVIEAEGSEE